MAMKRILVVSGSRADSGMLEWPIKVLGEHFEIDLLKIWGTSVALAYSTVQTHLDATKPDLLMVLGDRFEILAAATAAHLKRIPIAHLCGGDVTLGSYDDAMRDAISRMATYHFVTSTSAMARLTHFGFTNIHLVGSTGIDYIKHADWKKARPYAEPYVVVSYQAETIDGTNDIVKVFSLLDSKTRSVFILPNNDRGNDVIYSSIMAYAAMTKNCVVNEMLPHGEFLNLLKHCECFIGNSSAMLYEAPELGIKTHMIGKRQRGRVIPMGDGLASKRICDILRYTLT